jgi:hypothetical protein
MSITPNIKFKMKQPFHGTGTVPFLRKNSKENAYKLAPVSTDSVSAVSVIRCLPRPKTKLEN